MIAEEKFEAVSKEMTELLAKHGVEIIIRSELTFKEIHDTDNAGESDAQAD